VLSPWPKSSRSLLLTRWTVGSNGSLSID